jgi:tetratricopeptide (TPR) repeat protein
MNGRTKFRTLCGTTSPCRTIVAVCLIASLCTQLALVTSVAAPAPARDPEERNRQYQHAEALYLGGHLKEAAAAFDELSRAYPNDARIWLKYGNTLTKLGNLDNAATAFENAAAADPSQGNSSLNLALVRLEQAQAALDTARTRLTANSEEHAQADNLKRQLDSLLGTPESGVPVH